MIRSGMGYIVYQNPQNYYQDVISKSESREYKGDLHHSDEIKQFCIKSGY